MRHFLTLMLATLSYAAPALAEDSIVGHWLYFMKIYQGREIPEGPEATLRLHFEFSADGKSRLYWFHEGDRDHCERRGHYTVENSELVDTVDWVDPANTYGCNQDPDMQDGKLTRTPIGFRNGNLVMQLQLGEEQLFYVWKKIPG
jgi:hypothetical protein